MKSVGNQPLSFQLVFFFALALMLSSCAAPATDDGGKLMASQENEALKSANEQLSLQVEAQKNQITQLQVTLLEQYAEIDKLVLVNERLVREVVRNKETLRHRSNKVETVRVMAEIATVINTIKENQLTGGQKQSLSRAEQYMTQSTEELEKGNFDGASYLADEALELVQAIQLELNTDGKQGQDSVTDFMTPLTMKLLETSNVRNKPSLQAKVKYVLGIGEIVKVTGYKGEWVKVEDKAQEDAWIHCSLLSGPWK